MRNVPGLICILFVTSAIHAKQNIRLLKWQTVLTIILEKQSPTIIAGWNIQRIVPFRIGLNNRKIQ